MNSVWDAWCLLGSPNGSREGWKSLRIFPAAPFPIRAAREDPTGRQALLFELHSAAVSALREYPTAKGFEFFPENLHPGPSGMVRLCLVLASGFDPILFARLSQDVAEIVNSASDENEGVKVLLSRLETWQIFLRKYSEGLSQEEQIGFFGELWFLRHSMTQGLHPATAISAWKGPEGGLRDFVFDACEIEVKTTQKASSLFRVNYLSQLDETHIPQLFLCHVTLSLVDDGETLCEAVADVRAKLLISVGSASQQFERLLLMAGYSDHHANHYELRRYHVSSMKFYGVADNFPRVRPDDVRPGVKDGSYTVDIRFCSPFQVDARSILPLIGI